MNFSKHGIARKQREIASFGTKCAKKLFFYILASIIILCLGLGAIGISGSLGVFKGIIDTSPEITNIDVSPTGFSTFIFNSEGKQTAKLVAADSNRIPVTMNQIPENLAHCFVAIEDERFYVHNGIDIKGIIRAVAEGAKSKFKGMQGASTITQQLLKNNVFENWTEEDSMIDKVTRKIQEQYLAIELEKVMDKDKILENYMNTINLGQNTLGVQAASLRYFNKNVYELNLSECAVIAAITQNPSRYNPITHPEKNAERRGKVLRNMRDQGYVTQAEYDAAVADDVYSRIKNNNEIAEDIDSVNSYFDDAVTEQVYQDLISSGYTEQQAYTLLYTGGLSIYSTQDPRIQRICDDIYSSEENYPENTYWYLRYALTIEHLDGSTENFSSEMFKSYYKEGNAKFNMLYKSKEDAQAAIDEYKSFVMQSGDEVVAETINLTPQPQISLTVAEQNTGKVVAMVGGRGEKTASRTLNRATSTVRQPGSTFKVLSTFAPALDSAGLSLATVQNDAPYNYIGGTPVSNWYGSTYRGINSIRQGIKDSMNIVTVKTLTQIGPQLGFDYLINFGFTTLETGKEINGKIYSDIQQSLALGGITNGVTNLELNAAYACVANQGIYIKPRLYTKVIDHDGKILLDNTIESRQVIKETTAWLLTSAMKDVINGGTGGLCKLNGMTVAGKTGTTSDYNDVWFSGFTPYYTATTWSGYDNNAKLTSNSEHNLSKTMWQKVMSQIHEGYENKDFPVPSGIVTASVCSRSGKLPIPGLCDAHVHSEYFAEGTVPKESCDVHYAGVVCAFSLLPASDMCPFKSQGVFELPLKEDPKVAAGSATVTADGTSVLNANQSGVLGADGITRCQHNATFFADPTAEATIAQQSMALQIGINPPAEGEEQQPDGWVDVTNPAPPAEQPEAPAGPPAPPGGDIIFPDYGEN